jgi:DNA-binding response OmpR family regulator
MAAVMNADAVDAASLHGKLLLIDAEQASARIVAGLLAQHRGVSLVHATGGLAGVALALSERPDFVILDMRLPDIGGVEVVRRLNGEIAQRGLRVAILTSEQASIETVKAMSLGVFEYWPRPLEPRLLEAGVRRALTGRRPDPARCLPLQRRAERALSDELALSIQPSSGPPARRSPGPLILGRRPA